jgi:hypothetical protein
MVERSDRFPHIQLSLAKEGIAAIHKEEAGRKILKHSQILVTDGDMVVG